MIVVYFVSVILAFLLGWFVPKKKIKTLRKKATAIDLKEIQNFLSYDGEVQQ